MIVSRTLLALKPDALAAIDAELARTLTAWGPLSLSKTEQAMYSTDATLLNRRLTALARTVCDHDPRTIDQRRADALGAMAAGHSTLSCACGQPDCSAAESCTASSVVVHVVADAAALDATETSDLHGQRPGDGGPEIVSNPERLAELIREATDPRPASQFPTDPIRLAPNPGVVLGGPVVPAKLLAELAARGAVEMRPLIHPGQSPPEARYRPSLALVDFIRCRDLTCRFPGCDRPADMCDIDHTIPYPLGLTHASNLKCLCRKQHRTKQLKPRSWPRRGSSRFALSAAAYGIL